MTKSELTHHEWWVEWPTISGSVLGAYVAFLGGGEPGNKQAKIAQLFFGRVYHECSGRLSF